MATIQTRAQNDLRRAAGRVMELQERKDEPWVKTYGGLCHSFPVLVRTAGLCQAMAFHESKAAPGEGDRAKAHGRLIADVRALLGDAFDPGRVSLSEYLRATRQVLAAWVFYKRFAVSVLKAENAGAGDDDNND